MKKQRDDGKEAIMFDHRTAILGRERYTKASVMSEEFKWEREGRRDCRNGVKFRLGSGDVPKKFWDSYLTGYAQAQMNRKGGVA